MPKGVYLHKLRNTKISIAMREFLGRRPKNMDEYKKLWYILYKDKSENELKAVRKQRQRHLSHTGPASISRKYCIFCVKENEK